MEEPDGGSIELLERYNELMLRVILLPDGPKKQKLLSALADIEAQINIPDLGKQPGPVSPPESAPLESPKN